VRYVIRYALIAVYTVFWGTLACFATLFDRSGDAGMRIGSIWIGWILRTCRIRVQAEGLSNVDRGQSYVVMANHQSVFDIAAIVRTLPVPFRFVAKREIVWIPFFGWAAAMSGQILIDRSRRERAIRSLERAAGRIRNGMSVIIFPEGTRSETGKLRELKSGGFHLAAEARVPILPVSVSGSARITPRRSLRVESGTIRVTYGKPISASRQSTDEERAELKREVRSAILAGLDPRLDAT
jgi:1-acyl-sn-glycerol-3-phosphate acyltransferase